MATALLEPDTLVEAQPRPAPLIWLPRPLVFATYLSPNLHPFYQFITDYVGTQLERPTELVVGHSADELCSEAIDFAFVCGLPYVRLNADNPHTLFPLTAPVLSPSRYEGKPVYFSDVIVGADSPFNQFADLRGASWAYNEIDSHSGWLVTLHHLLQQGLSPSFFGRWEETGYHIASIAAVSEGRIDASAIDSQVLAVAMHSDPSLLFSLRVIDSFGPSTIQPLAATRRVAPALRAEVQQIVAAISKDHEAMAFAQVEHFAIVSDSSYDDIRAMRAAVAVANFSF